MIVHLRFFASLRERMRRNEADRQLPDGSRIEDLWVALCADHPQLKELGASVTFAVNREYVKRDHVLAPDDEVALIPPVSGGRDVSDRFPSD